ncbi:MAG: VWA domain-containing protein [Bacteroidales bacterium]|jgi:Ca-activated chloride channel family protein|nr:VWA domain-containing protein [Bacteroidales bacterium]
MFRFQNINYLWFLIIPIILVVLFIISELIRKKRISQIGDSKLLKILIPGASIKRKIWKMILAFLAFSLIIIALARPQFGSKIEEVTTKGIEVMVAIDVSNSMMSQDIKPNRLDNAKKIAEKIINKLNNNKLGLIVFAGDAFIQMPLTEDVRAARMYLQGINTKSVQNQGTDIGTALDLASKSFSSNNELSKVIILITDGENHEDDPFEIAKKLKEQKILVFSIGMGSPKGSPIMLGNKGFLKDKEGNVVISALDEKTLIQIANETNGFYVRANNSSMASDNVISEIEKIEKGEITKHLYSEYDDRFFYFALLAFLLLIADCFISEKKIERTSKLKLFETNN